MKKLLALTLSVASFGFAASSVEAKATESPATTVTINAAEPQIRVQIGQNRRNNRRIIRNNRVRTVTQTRIVRVGRQRYRETIQVRYLPNGRTQTRVISRVRTR
jgi:hypothetical protein